MNILVYGYYDEKDTISLNETLKTIMKKFRVRKYYINADYDEKLELTPFKELNNHDNPSVDWSVLKPLDGELLKKMADCEVTVLKMMDRLECEQIKHVTYAERKRLYLRYLRYCNDFLKNNKINMLLHGNVPHSVYDFIIYSLCRVKGIPVIFVYQVMEDMMFFESKWENLGDDIRKEYARMEKGTNVTLAYPYSTLFNKQTSKKNPVQFYMIKENAIKKYFRDLLIGVRTNPKIFIRKMSSLTYWKTQGKERINKFIHLLKSKILFTYYNARAEVPDLQRKYIYIPLHYQPERSTSPLAGSFVNQLLIIEMLSVLIPENTLLFVKEHPRQHDIGRDRHFYQDLKKYRNVKLMPRDFDSFTLINHCLAVATATGMAGIEGLFREKPVIWFGHDFFQFAPGSFRVSKLKDCEYALNQIINKQVKPKLCDIKLYLKAMEKIGIVGYVSPDYRKVSLLSTYENNRNITEGLIRKMKQLGFKTYE